MRRYELVLVFAPEEKEEERKKLLEKIETEVGKLKGKVEKVDEWGKKELAYRIKRQSEGVFFFLTLSLPPEAVVALEKKIKIEEKIIRFLLVRAQEREGVRRRKNGG